MPPKSAQNAPAIPTSGPPRLSVASCDGDLLEALRRSPNLMRTAYSEAETAHNRLSQNPHFPAAELGVAAFWMAASWQYRRALPRGLPGMPVDQVSNDAAMVTAFRIIISARDLLCGLLADLPLLHHGDLLALRGQVFPADAAIAAAEAKCPGLKAWQAGRRASAEAAQAAQDQQSARQAEASEAASKAAQEATARELVRRLAHDGVTLTAGPNGIVAQPAGLLAESDRTAIMKAKPMLAELLAETATF